MIGTKHKDLKANKRFSLNQHEEMLLFFPDRVRPPKHEGPKSVWKKFRQVSKNFVLIAVLGAMPSRTNTAIRLHANRSR